MSAEISWVGAVAPTLALSGAASVLLITVALTARRMRARGSAGSTLVETARIAAAFVVLAGAVAVWTLS